MDDVPELIDLLNDLQGKATKWYGIGVQLHMPTDELDVIKCDSNGVEECFRNMLIKWRSKTRLPPTWRALIVALKTPAVDEQVLAENLEARFGVPRAPNISGRAHTASESMHLSRCRKISIIIFYFQVLNVRRLLK